jgi:hypothetical protein
MQSFISPFSRDLLSAIVNQSSAAIRRKFSLRMSDVERDGIVNACERNNSIKEKMRCDGNVAVMEVECGIRL